MSYVSSNKERFVELRQVRTEDLNVFVVSVQRGEIWEYVSVTIRRITNGNDEEQ